MHPAIRIDICTQGTIQWHAVYLKKERKKTLKKLFSNANANANANALIVL